MEFKCKSCGAQLHFDQGQISSKCEYCGNTYMIFDFLDKETQRYQEKKHLVNKDNSRYKEIYSQYADIVISPEHYCLSASDFIDIIEFFDSAEKNDKTIELLDHAKLCFINCVESYEDCLLAVKYVEEIKLPLFDDKSEAKSALMRLAYSYRRKELIKSGFVVEVPQTKSEDDFIQLVKSLLLKNDVYHLFQPFEQEIIRSSRNNAIKYIIDNGKDVINEVTSVSNAKDIQSSLMSLVQKGILPSGCFLLEHINKRIEFITNEEQKHKKKQKYIICCSFLVFAFSLICCLTFTIRGHSIKNISITVVSKTNDAYNENLVSGHRDSGYFYTFVLDVKNSSPYDVKLIRGDMEVFNKNGDLLSTSSAEIRGNVLRKSSEKYGIQLHTEKGENAREIWNTSLDELKIVFKINAVHFSDGKIKTYRNVKEIVIHEIK